jgi:hypothetical protein
MKAVKGVVSISNPDFVLLDSGSVLAMEQNPTTLTVFLDGAVATINLFGLPPIT